MGAEQQKDMPGVSIGRYSPTESPDYAGYVQPKDHRWILFIRRDNRMPVLFDRDPVTGAYLPSHTTDMKPPPHIPGER